MSKEYLNQYTIIFRGLPLGEHIFWFDIDDKFFIHFTESEVNQGKIRVKVEMNVKHNSLAFNIKLKGKVKLQCDLCLEDFYKEIKHRANLYVDFGEQNSDITDVDENLILSHDENEINLAQHFYEYINLALPIRRVHPKDENGKRSCNPEMLKRIEELNAKNKISTDNSAWEKLKNLYN